MLDPRLYRAAFVPVLLAVLVAAFSIENRPRAIGTTLAPDAFDAAKAMQTLDSLAGRFPVRRPGDAADEQLAATLARQLRARGPYQVREQRFRGRTIDGKRDLVNVVATRPGAQGPGIVVVAHRDAAAPGARAELSGTAGLLELARVVGDGRLTRTVTFISTTGGSGGFAGAREAARRLADPADTVLVLGDLASLQRRRPYVVGWSNGPGEAPLRLSRTVDAAVRAEAGTAAGFPRAVTQWARYAVPVTVGEQGPFGREGHPAAMLSVNGERGPAADTPVREARMEAFGRATLRTLYALDGGPAIGGGPTTDLVTRGKVVPSWAIRLLVGALLLPVLLAAVDALARARRRREAVGRWVRWTLGSALPFALACLFVIALALVGLIDAAPGAPIPERALELGGGAAAGLIAGTLVFVLGWVVVRPWVVRGTGRPDAPGAAVAVWLVTVGVAAVLWVLNPYAAALLVPAAHLWLWATVPDSRLPRAGAVAMVLAGLLPIAAVGLVDARAFGLGPVEGWWFWTLLVAGGHIPVISWLLWSVAWGCAVSALLIVLRRRRRAPAGTGDVTVRGPVTYAGPGSLGGTESALRR
jgi:Peptidase family M28